MFNNLLAAIESDINSLSATLKDQNLPREKAVDLNEKKVKLADIAMQYVRLENQYRELSGANSIY